jgi:hypothetical protein
MVFGFLFAKKKKKKMLMLLKRTVIEFYDKKIKHDLFVFFQFISFQFSKFTSCKKESIWFQKNSGDFHVFDSFGKCVFFCIGRPRKNRERERGRKFFFYFRDTTSQSSNAKDTIKEFHLDKAQLAFTIGQKKYLSIIIIIILIIIGRLECLHILLREYSLVK